MSSSNHIISVIVENKPGVLFKAANMFRRRGFNIESLTVGRIARPGLSKMTIVVNGDERTTEQLIKQIAKLLDVIKITELGPKTAVIRELALVRISTTDQKAMADITHFARAFEAKTVDVTKDSTTVELTGDSDRIDDFVKLVQAYGIKDISRTGLTAIHKGAEETSSKKQKQASE
jgi:acetolactate synthase-1/3 small subunit